MRRRCSCDFLAQSFEKHFDQIIIEQINLCEQRSPTVTDIKVEGRGPEGINEQPLMLKSPLKFSSQHNISTEALIAENWKNDANDQKCQALGCMCLSLAGQTQPMHLAYRSKTVFVKLAENLRSVMSISVIFFFTFKEAYSPEAHFSFLTLTFASNRCSINK